MKTEVQYLKWDSDFFGFPVYFIDKTFPTEQLETILQSLYKDEIAALIYLSRSKKLPTIISSEYYSFDLIDEKATFTKSIKTQAKVQLNQNVKAFDEFMSEKKVIELAIESGVYSRFKLDKNIPLGKYQELYKLWAVNSINKKIAQEVLVYMVGKEIAGMITLGEKNGNADIGIIAVDPMYRGKGIAAELIKSAECWFAEHAYPTVQVVTQKANIPAVGLYSKLGFKESELEFYYHLWRN